MLYGIVVILFFQCMGSLMGSGSRTMGRIKWGLVAHTAAMFSFVTIFTVTNMDLLSISYIDNRAFPGDNMTPPGPFGYQFLVYSEPINVTPYIMFFLNSWLADGLLLYRCCIIYAMNYWAITFPCLMYLASFVTGIIFLCKNSRPDGGTWTSSAVNLGYPSFLTSLFLNVLLTLMITVRLALHNRNIKNVLGPSAASNGLYKTVVTILIESFALYTVNFLLFIGTWGTKSYFVYTFFPILVETQAIAPLLIISRVVNRSAPANNVAFSGYTGSIHFRSRWESSGAYGTLLDESSMGPMGADGEITGELGARVEDTVDENSP